MKYKLPAGTQDILPDEIPLWHHLERTTHRICEIYGYREIRTPVFEYTPLFTRSIGETTDIVEKQMYTFTSDKSEDSITLRPELTAPVVRAYLEHNLAHEKKFQKLYYLGPLFRHERPQKGRMRQFHQVGIEALGSSDALVDVEVILLALEIISKAGLKNANLVVNSLGCSNPKCKELYQREFTRHAKAVFPSLCQDCKRRVKRNILRALDCKNEQCRNLVRRLPAITTWLCPECQTHFGKAKETLSKLGVSYEVDPYLVRGIDYYTKTIFEIRHPSLGAQNALCGGGRYDNLVEELGGPATPAVGCAMGMERIILAIKAETKDGEKQFAASRLKLFIALVGPEVRTEGFNFLKELRQKGISADMDYESRSLKAQLRLADKVGARYVIILGTDELTRGIFKLKDMASGKEEALKKEELYEKICH